MRTKAPKYLIIALVVLCLLALAGAILGILKGNINDRVLTELTPDVPLSGTGNILYNTSVPATEAPMRGYVFDA